MAEIAPPVFISYAREASSEQAQALKDRLDSLAFLDTGEIDDGDSFPKRLLDGLLGARVVVVFATASYLERRFCRLELRLALAGGDTQSSHLMVALGLGGEAVLEALPPEVAGRNWPPAAAAARVEALARKLLAKNPPAIGERLRAEDARQIGEAFLEESTARPPEALPETRSLPAGVAGQSIGPRFVGRAGVLHRMHSFLSGRRGRTAHLTGRLTGGGGFGKTRLAVEYMHRYASFYPGGVFWINADSGAIEQEWWRVLAALDPGVPDLAVMRGQGRDVQRELERALRGIRQPALYVIDNIPEAGAGAAPPETAVFCPAPDAVTILATSRQDTREAHVQRIPVEELERDAAILLLTDGVPGAAALAWAEWARIAEWVGDLPVALDLLNRSLALGAIAMRALLGRVDAPGAAGELDRLSEALRGQVPANALRGVTETLSISLDKLDRKAREAAMLLAQLAPAPIPEQLMEALPEELGSPAVRAALRSRHFVTGAGELVFGTMHRLTAEFLRMQAEPGSLERACDALLEVMTPDRCRDPRHWPVMRLCRPHAEALFDRGARVDDAAQLASRLGLRVAILAGAQGAYSGARRVEERVVDVCRRLLGQEHPDTLTSMNNLAATLLAQGDVAGARRMQEQVVEASTRVKGEDQPHTLTSMNNLAETLRAQGDLPGALRMHERVLEVRKRVLGEEDPDTLASMNNLALTQRDLGDLTGARRTQEQVLGVIRRVLGEEHQYTLMSMDNLAYTLRAQGDVAEARRLHERVVEAMTRVLGEEHPATLTSMNNLAFTLRDLGDSKDALRLLRACLAGRRKVLGEDHPDTQAAAETLRQWEAEANGQKSPT